MNVVYSDRAKQPDEFFELMLQATGKLKEILGSAQDSIRACWDRIEDERGRPLYSLTLADFAGETEARFTPEELGRGTHITFTLARLCNKLLQIRERKLWEALREPIEAEVD